MLSHATTRDWLIPYADGMLAADERRRVDGHLTGCGSCAAELREVRELNLLLVSLPPAPPTSFAPFWLKLQAVLPQRRTFRITRLFGYRRTAVAFAAAGALAVSAAGTALAAPSAMPDSVIYPVKQLEEGLELAATPSSSRLAFLMAQAKERLREAAVMSANHKPLLAAATLTSFQVTLKDASASLKNPADPRRVRDDLKELRTRLDAVERQNAARDDDDSQVRQLVIASVDDLDRIENPDAATPASTIIIGTKASPDPTPGARPQPVVKPTPRPEPSEDEKHH
jgi:hypothetical protein